MKQCAILASAALIAVCDQTMLKQDKDRIFGIFAERLSNEVTREVCLKALLNVATYKNQSIQISNLPHLFSQFFSLLKKTSR